MKCSDPECNRGIGLVSHQRGWFSKQRYCSRRCRDAFKVEQQNPSSQERSARSYFEWLISQPTGNPQPKLMGAMARVRAR
jgi:hypothetical protein